MPCPVSAPAWLRRSVQQEQMCTPDSILQFEGKQCRFRQQRVYFRAKSLGDEGKKDLCKQWLVNLRREKTATTKLCPQNCRLLQRSQQAVQGIQHVLKRLTASLACATRAWKDNSELCHFAQKKTVFGFCGAPLRPPASRPSRDRQSGWRTGTLQRRLEGQLLTCPWWQPA